MDRRKCASTAAQPPSSGAAGPTGARRSTGTSPSRGDRRVRSSAACASGSSGRDELEELRRGEVSRRPLRLAASRRLRSAPASRAPVALVAERLRVDAKRSKVWSWSAWVNSWAKVDLVGAADLRRSATQRTALSSGGRSRRPGCEQVEVQLAQRRARRGSARARRTGARRPRQLRRVVLRRSPPRGSRGAGLVDRHRLDRRSARARGSLDLVPDQRVERGRRLGAPGAAAALGRRRAAGAARGADGRRAALTASPGCRRRRGARRRGRGRQAGGLGGTWPRSCRPMAADPAVDVAFLIAWWLGSEHRMPSSNSDRTLKVPSSLPPTGGADWAGAPVFLSSSRPPGPVAPAACHRARTPRPLRVATASARRPAPRAHPAIEQAGDRETAPSAKLGNGDHLVWADVRAAAGRDAVVVADAYQSVVGPTGRGITADIVTYSHADDAPLAKAKGRAPATGRPSCRPASRAFSSTARASTRSRTSS